MEATQNAQWTIDLSVAVGPQLRRILRERIIRADLTPGSLLSEAEIARSYAVSRQPVREAFIKLAEEGLVEVRPQRGTVVRKISRSQVMDARFVREAVEADIVKLLAKCIDRAAISELRKLLALQKEAAKGDRIRFMELDDQFHRTLAAAAGRGGAWHVIEESKAQMDRVRFLSFGQFPMDKLIAQHEAVVDAVAEGRTDDAEASMRGHLREVLVDLPKIAEAVPDYFEA
ncbi:putative HTH-type transcriptional regulator YdfH [Hartmannibacter diazotrophicus]|uniref:Putative HTH-type transcriptional regulator YdfH n=1 Tax=Hartmannibacter diazotrophicus TaxID=1482074 RepID=A0A2C9DAU3_9HYPH|nr:GntR family transcriptional regulator [Hartmannibacter diazotrophicus]SON57444.1 putative HTH-type transcriptional regulator YdfH [Hartmannibacter diazotrophicus]